MATTISSTALDFTSIKNNLKTFLAAKSEYADYNFEGSGLSNILDVLAYNTHYNGLVTNFALNESYLSTAQLRSSVVSLAEGIGYVPRSKQGAIAQVNLSVNTGDLVGRPVQLQISKGTKFTSDVDGITYTFQTRADAVATDNGFGLYSFKVNEVEDIIIQEGESQTKTFYIGADSIDNVYIIPDVEMDITSAEVRVYETVSSEVFSIYTNIKDATTFSSASTLYILKESPNKFFELTFGDNVTLGKSPVAGNKVEVVYLRTKGSVANGATVFSPSSQVTVGVDNFPITVTTVINSYNGSEKESTESIRKNAPFQYATQNRMVTADDYSSLVQRNFGSLITDIKAFGGEDALLPQYGCVFLSIVFNDNITTAQINATKQSIVELADQLSIVGFDLKFEDPIQTFVETQVYFQFNPKLSPKALNTISEEVQTAVTGYFTGAVGKFGQSFRRSNMLALIDDVDPAVLSSRADILVQHRFTPTLNKVEDHKLRYPVSIDSPDDKLFKVTSTVFNYAGITSRIKNKLSSNTLQVVALIDETVQNDNIGSYDPTSGIVDIVALKVDGLISGDDFIKMSIVPANQSAISPVRNDILSYDLATSFSSGIIVTST